MICPACKNKISWLSIGKYTNWFFKRLIDDCPHCHLKIILIKTPLRVMNLGLIFLVGSLFSSLFLTVSYLTVLLFSTALGCFFYTCVANKLKVARISR